MAVVRSLFGRFSGDASSDLKTPGNLVCLGDDDRVADEPSEAISDALDGLNNDQSVVAEKFSFGVEFGDAAEQTLGQLMTASREHRGLSREQVAEQTRIPAYYVRMIESDSYDAIPDQLYLLPFFRRYAIFLGLDEQKVVSRFIRDFEKSENEIVETKAVRSKGPNLKLWRQAASAVVIVGLLLIFLARGIAMMRSTLDHPADTSSPVAISQNALPPSTILPQDAPPPLNDAPRLVNDAPRPLNDAPHQLSDAPHPSIDLPHPVADIQPAETPDAAPSPAISTASAAPHVRHHRRHAHDATPPLNDAPHLVNDAPGLVSDAPHPGDASHQPNDATRLSTAPPQPVAAAQPAETPAAPAPSPAITTASAAPHTKHHHRHARSAHGHRLTRSGKHSKPTT